MSDALPALDSIIPGLTITSAGGVCPFEAEGTIRTDTVTHEWTYRERGGRAKFTLYRGDISFHEDPIVATINVPEFRETGDAGGGPWFDTTINLIATNSKLMTILEPYIPSSWLLIDRPVITNHVSPRGEIRTPWRADEETLFNDWAYDAWTKRIDENVRAAQDIARRISNRSLDELLDLIDDPNADVSGARELFRAIASLSSNDDNPVIFDEQSAVSLLCRIAIQSPTHRRDCITAVMRELGDVSPIED